MRTRRARWALSSGFTLVEMMVVVSLIGVMITIAVPQYKKYVAKAKQTEAKLALVSLHTLQSSFAAQNSSFTACIAATGYRAPNSTRYYAVGFLKGASNTPIPASAALCGPSGSRSCLEYGWELDASGNYVVIPGSECLAAEGETIFANGVVVVQGKKPPTISFISNAHAATSTTTTDPYDVYDSYVEKTKFRVITRGKITKGAPVDLWSIDQNKQLLHDANGI